ncbi:50S ribosomal protein L25 [Candidatus Kaiserbacteria bacterium]|nr:50S ribosomal protein L25 [Candidatus Kaiserbacteria bacterium]
MQMLSVKKRDASLGSARALRHTGSIPGVVYGPHQEATPLAVEAKAFDKAFAEAGEATVIALSGLGADLPVLIHDIDLDPLTHRPRHVDFYAFPKGERVQVAVPLSFVGESEAVKVGANLIKVLHELEVRADPMNLPHALEADLALLAKLGDQIHARDIKLPSGVELMVDPGEVVALTQEVVEEKEEAPAEVDLGAIEVEKKGKEEAEGEAPPVPEAKPE